MSAGPRGITGQTPRRGGPRHGLFVLLLVLGVMHGAVAFAGFLAPYAPEEQVRGHPYAPPTRVHSFDAKGIFHLRPFTYAWQPADTALGDFVENRSQAFPIYFFLPGTQYRLLGIIPCRRHLFGAEGNRINLLGTDGYGRDQFSRLLYGGQISLLAGWLAAALALSGGLAIGAVAGFWGGWVDDLLMRVAELFLALPWLYLLFALRAFLPLAVTPLQAFFLVVGVIGAVGWARPARLLRGAVLSAKERDFVRAARGFGASGFYLLRRHVLPQTYSVLLTQASVLVPQYILAEVTLSFLGLGVPEPVPSWGNLLVNLQQYSVLSSYWWMCLPALVMVPFFLGYLGLASALQAWSGPAKIRSAEPENLQ